MFNINIPPQACKYPFKTGNTKLWRIPAVDYIVGTHPNISIFTDGHFGERITINHSIIDQGNNNVFIIPV